MRTLGIFLVLLVPLVVCVPVTSREGMQYLQTYGYLQPARLRSDSTEVQEEDPEIATIDAIKLFQEDAGISQTGELDKETLDRMGAPRCGVPHVASYSWEENVNKWSKTDLTYNLNSTGSGMLHSVTRRALRAAFDVFEAVTPLKFIEVDHEGDINVKFFKRHHNCFRAFDGRGGTLAHAVFPEEGIIHFDADERWTVMGPGNLPIGTHQDFLTTAIHEIGHAVGLDHVKDPTSIMALICVMPVDRKDEYRPPRLDTAVIKTLQGLYGTASDPKVNVGPSDDKEEIDRTCLKDVYAVASISPHRFILFYDKGRKWALFGVTSSKTKAIQKGSVETLFRDGPEQVFAAYYDTKSDGIMLFRENKVWRYTVGRNSVRLSIGYPKRLPRGWATEAAFYSIPNSTIVSLGETVASFNDHSMNVKGTLSETFPNLPTDFIGFAEIFYSGSHVGFTDKKLFHYDFDDQTVEYLGAIGDLLEC